jgi:agmatine/peptidylarginine deiminase
VPDFLKMGSITILRITRLMREAHSEDAYPSGYNHCSSYINFAHVNVGTIVPEYGDLDGDKCARAMIAEAFDNRLDIESTDVRGIAVAGGGIHCVTHHEPFLEDVRSQVVILGCGEVIRETP